jgi:hypothetical protein
MPRKPDVYLGRLDVSAASAILYVGAKIGPLISPTKMTALQTAGICDDGTLF